MAYWQFQQDVLKWFKNKIKGSFLCVLSSEVMYAKYNTHFSLSLVYCTDKIEDQQIMCL